MARLAILASGRGTNFVAICDAVKKGKLASSSIVGLLTHNPAAKAIEEANKRGIPNWVIPTPLSNGKPNRSFYEQQLGLHLEELSPDYICLAGYMRVFGNELVKRWQGKLLNIHPSLLPAFPGLEARQQALDYGVKWTGCTVHFVTERVDEGPIVGQSIVEVLEGDTSETLEQRMLPVEHELYVNALQKLITRTYQIDGRRVVWTPSQKK